MPRMDGTGPMGQGPMTGWGFGPCAGAGRAVYGRRFGSGFGRRYGRGYGQGFRRSYQSDYGADIGPEDRKEFLENHKRAIKAELEAINEALEDLE